MGLVQSARSKEFHAKLLGTAEDMRGMYYRIVVEKAFQPGLGLDLKTEVGQKLIEQLVV